MMLPTITVLIVEDLLVNRELYRYCLLDDVSCAYSVLEAESVAEGLELCRTRSIDAILLDYSLPDGDGLEFLETLAIQSNHNSPSVVMMTGHGNESIAVRAMKLGAHDYLAKHKFTPELLRSTMRSAIENARLRRQLRQREERFQASVENMLECFGIYSALRDDAGQIRDFRFDYLNAAALESNQMTAADLDRGLCDVFPAIRETGLFAEYCQVVETGTPLVKEDLVYSDVFGGKILTRAYNIQIAKLDDGFVASWQDITAQKQVYLARIAAEQERDRFFNLSIDLLAVANFDIHFTRLNPAWEKLLGFTIAELMARPFIDFVHPEDRATTLAAAKQASRGEMVTSFENRYRCQDGSYRWLLWSAMPYVEQALFYAIAHDITDRKQAEIDLAWRNQELDSFVHIVSHDLKAPLRAIANLSQWIEEDFQGAISAHSQQQMTLLRSRVYSMEAKIDGLLDYARIGKTDAESELVATAQLVAEIVEILAPAPTFTISISPALPILSANRLLLSQVFANTIGNAIEHHDRTDGLIKISCQTRSDCYEFAIADDGVGIAPEHHERIFGIFQAMNPQNRSNSTGIGLAIVKKIVEAEGGTIWLESQMGEGTTFYFTWPKPGRSDLGDGETLAAKFSTIYPLPPNLSRSVEEKSSNFSDNSKESNL
ncbi:ATP-binding protein [Chamaesiphon sp. OTE_75_metabat_556]|uniref:ATP-binding protein n=1 Tax=Chamaesiphon sp. OTE_75_metabat_556 TaxID=2964692 RepID=UPI00286A0C00|nr:ATP-binding protein [Chamaesiphon sp. OTE_75_metabat_556]